SLTRSQFFKVWEGGAPLLITGIEERLQGHWGPEYFISTHGALKVAPIDCTTDKVADHARISAAEFFRRFNDEVPCASPQKLKDWPPAEDFRRKFETLHKAFMTTMPIECQDLARNDGIYNLSAHFPTQAVAPDLGPKLYIAMATADDNTGTTKAHLDVTDAINILAWSRGDGPAALWHIFPAAHTATVRHFLRQEYALPGEIDPVHSQKYYLSDAKLARLKDMHGISPWTLHQRVGDAILIPAGCIHQVRNISSAIKVACDFVSPQNIQRTLKLAQELRLHRISSRSGEDLLQLRTMVWFAWL
ncbi:hypothetical protein C8Q76DRAFT_590035, partial [Earliella scabrosa]